MSMVIDKMLCSELSPACTAQFVECQIPSPKDPEVSNPSLYGSCSSEQKSPASVSSEVGVNGWQKWLVLVMTPSDRLHSRARACVCAVGKTALDDKESKLSLGLKHYFIS